MNEPLITEEQIRRNDHIPIAKINQDIADTEHEITTMEREIKGFELLGDRMSIFRANARRDGIKRRELFIKKLNVILDHRKGGVKDDTATAGN